MKAIYSILKLQRWSPYAVGICIGVLSVITFSVMDKSIGTSTTMVRTSGALERIVSPEHVSENEYFTKYLGTPEKPKPVFEWQFALVVMIFFGALFSTWLSNSFHIEKNPELWKWRFGKSVAYRYIGAFLAGALLLFGARLAGGCTSGHGLSGTMQLALSSWVFFASLFIAGLATAKIIYGKEGKKHV